MRVLVLGGTGMLGHKVYAACRRRFDTWVTTRSARRLRGKFDETRTIYGVNACQLYSVAQAISTAEPDVVINCIGIVKQLDADAGICVAVNSLFPHQLAGTCVAAGARLIHISTDCVFSGRRGMYAEEDAADPEDVYGRSKLLGEVTGPGCLTIRTSFIGRELDTANGLLEWFISQKGGTVKGYRNAIWSGYTTTELARQIASVVGRDLTGLYHVASEPISKYDLLGLINERLELGVEIEPDDTVHCDRSLDSTRWRAATGFASPPWSEMMQDIEDMQCEGFVDRGGGKV